MRSVTDKDNKVLEQANRVIRKLWWSYKRTGDRQVRESYETIQALLDRLRRMDAELGNAVNLVAKCSKRFGICDTCAHWREQCRAYDVPNDPIRLPDVCARCERQSEWEWGGGK